jgi:hypothetical protein
MIPRRAFLVGTVALAACRPGAQARCGTCGMKIDFESPWRAELLGPSPTVEFDSPRCALLAWRNRRVVAKQLLVQEFYDRAWRDGAEVRFVWGSDVVGPMGADFVPVDPTRVGKFLTDHHASRALALSEITSDVLAELT